MTDNESEMSHDEIRAALIAKLDATWPAYKDDPVLARSVELGSNSDLRKHLVWAELRASLVPEAAIEKAEPSPLMPTEKAELMRRVLTTRTGNELPPHKYVLARDECDWYGGPSWVPFNLWQDSEYCGYGSVVQECARKLIETTGAEALWDAIAKRYARPDRVSVNLSIVCADALASWRVMPRDTPSDFREGREGLARRAEQLALELERFFLPRDPDKHELPGLLDFTQLMSEEECERFDIAIRRATGCIVNRARRDAGVRALDWEEYNDDHGGEIYSDARLDAREIYPLLLRDHSVPESPRWRYGGVPTLPEMLRRIAGIFREDGDQPPLTRPNLANAERNFFTRFLCKYFWTSFGDVSPAIVRDIVSIFYPQGIGDNDVSQVIARVKRDYPLPADPENSSPK